MHNTNKTILGPAMAFDTAHFYHHYVPAGVWKNRQHIHRRVNPILFYMSGITIWNYFSSCLNNTSSTFVANAGIFGKVYFPRLIIPLSNVLSNIVKFGIQFLLLLVMMIYYSLQRFPIHFSIAWLWIPVLLLMMAGLGLGLGIIISSLTTKYRDLTVLDRICSAVTNVCYAHRVSFVIHKR